MKKLLSKIFSVIIIMMMCVGIIGCAGSGQGASSASKTNETNSASKEASSEKVAGEKSNTDTDSSNKKSIVIYFSCTGNTENVAKNAADILGADIYEILPKDEYTEDDLNYSNSSSRTSIEQNDENARPEIKSEKLDLSKYDNVLIGYPIWWGKAPRIINTFIESYDLAGKNVIPFCTSGSSDIDGSVSELKEKYPSISWQDGKRFAGDASKDEISKWISKVIKK